MVNSIIKEIELRKDEMNFTIETIYFGGGTPSLLNELELNLIFNSLHQYFKINKEVEICIEANPDDITKEKIMLYKSLGINRMSIGIQSFNNKDLKFMDRIHTGKESEDCIKIAQDNGINNLSIDLIFGSPTTTNSIWEKNLKIANSLKIPHISTYALTVEKNTKLSFFIQSNKISPLDEERMFNQFTLTKNYLTNNLYKHYEFSNYAKENYTSLHNSNYWKDKPYLGIGPSAHSYNGSNTRSWNISNNTKYIKSISENIIPKKIENLTEIDKFNEYIMTNIRTFEGLDTNYIYQNFNSKLHTMFNLKVKEMIALNKLIVENNYIKASSDFYFLLDKISSELFIEN